MKISFDKIIISGFLIAILLFSIVGVLSSRLFYQFADNTLWVDHTFQALLQLKDVDSGMKNMEASIRGFTISADNEYLESYHVTLLEVMQAIKNARHLTTDNLYQQNRLDRFEPLITQNIALMNQIIDYRCSNRFEIRQELLLFKKEKVLTEQISLLSKEMEAQENMLLKQRYNKEQYSSELTVKIITVVDLLALMIIFVAMVLILREIKDRRLAEDRLQNQKKNLEREMKIRRLAEDRLKNQKKDLEEVNLELDSFVYTASHDLRAPLRAISSFASFLDEDYGAKFDDQAKGYLNEIRKGTERMNNVIEDLLTLSRIARIKNPYEDVNMDQLIDSVIKRQEFDIAQYHVDLKVEKGIPIIRCDRIKITEVFVNLIHNAIKFSSKDNKGNPVVEIGYKSRDGFHEFYVKDNGIGIDPQFHKYVFGLFKRLHTVKEYDGTGAGLNIVQRVIDGHGGRVWVESQLGQGATFYFTIAKNLK